MYYVYQYLREDGTPYYIGKGKGNRAWVRGKRETPRRPACDSRIEIIARNLSEEEALMTEINLIEKYGRKDIGTGILRNRTDGGEGASGRIMTEDHKRKISEANKGHTRSTKHLHTEEIAKKRAKTLTGRKFSEETKEKLRQAHLGKKQTEDHKRKISVSHKGKSKTTKHADNISKAKMGNKNPNYGKMWITNGESNMLINKENEIPKGWKKGRKV